MFLFILRFIIFLRVDVMIFAYFLEFHNFEGLYYMISSASAMESRLDIDAPFGNL